ncbi:MAG: sigma-70 family RNA polymerase sigma factor [Acetatifactor sp.]|nr:sigma-70 family RNA polymerase sigma factor [Acetatifactor sp.]MDE6700707.1 sigma-70 family RNA polymerase sigma factor [Acetatifactor sp.]
MEDSEIVELYFARSEAAIQETERKYGAFLKRVVYNILRSLCDTEEIVNDTYMGAWKAIPPTRPDNFKHFLSRIARNLSFDRLDYLNAGKRQALFVEMEECIPDRQHDIENLWEAREVGRVLNRFLETLDNRSCAVFLARYYYACSISELAKQYSLSERQVKYLLSKTRKRLRACFEKEGVAL